MKNEDIMEEKISSRRRILSVMGAGIASTPYLSGVVGASTDSPDYQWFYEKTAQKYGKREANISLQIVRDNYRRKEKKGLSQLKTTKNITQDILDHPNTPKGSAAIRQYQEKFGTFGKRPDSDQKSPNQSEYSTSSEQVGTDDFNDGGGGGSDGEIELNYSNTVKNADYGAVVDAAADVSTNKLQAYVTTGTYGAGYAEAWLWGRYYPETSGDHEFTADYYRLCHVANAEIEIRAFSKRDGGGMNDNGHVFENITGPRDGNTVESTNLSLSSSYSYDVGIIVKAHGGTASGSGAVADALKQTISGSTRLVSVDNFTITPL